MTVTVINLRDFLDAFTLERAEQVLSTFSCDLNSDIENFIKNDAIDFSNRGITQTHLVMGNADGAEVLLGYFALTNKVLPISPEHVSKSLLKKVSRFGIPDENTGIYNIPLPLIAQLGKNYSDHLDQYLTGNLLLEIACGKVASIQRELSGKLVYIECENKKRLVEFYSKNQFRDIGNGIPNPTTGLLQMIRYL
jgi:hypothetical protein